jgi:sulfatase modifying factor 1
VLATDGGPTGLADPATVSGFRLDKYDVTVGRFRQFVNAWNGGAGWMPSAGSGKHSHLNEGKGLADSGNPGSYETGWLPSDNGNVAPTDANLATTASGLCHSASTWTSRVGKRENLPINCVTWQEAYAFCIWDGGFLPSEAEWEYAAAGGSQEREYPWGSTDPGRGSQYAIYALSMSTIAPVGTATLGAGEWGQLDLAGNVLQWSLDWFATYVDPCTDCARSTAPSIAVGRVLRGGNFHQGVTWLLPPFRYNLTSPYRGQDVGFRCARTP